jgi:hypothetical protein
LPAGDLSPLTLTQLHAMGAIDNDWTSALLTQAFLDNPDLRGGVSAETLAVETAARIAGDSASVATASTDATTKSNAAQAFAIQRSNHTGTQAQSTVVNLVSDLAAKQPLATVLTNTTAAFTTAQETKLAGIATGATANATDAQLRDRSTHTGTQLAATISDFAATVRSTVATGISFVTATAVTAADTVLVSLGKLQAQITALFARTISGGGLVTGGGDLSANRTLTVTASTTAQGIAGTNTTTAMTPAADKAALDAALAPVQNSRLPRQALVFDGTVGITQLTTSIGTSGYTEAITFRVPTNNPASNVCLAGISASQPGWYSGPAIVLLLSAAGGLDCIIQSDGSGSNFASYSVAGFRASYSGQDVQIVYGRGGIAINGVYVATVPSVNGTGSISASIASAYRYLNAGDGAIIPTTILTIYSFNYNLTAAKVAALFRDGVPDAVDRGGSMVALNTSAFFNSVAIPFSSFSGTSTTGFTATGNGGNNRALMGPYNIEAGKEYTVTLTGAGTAIALMFAQFTVENVSADSNAVVLAAGSNTFVLTANKTGASFFQISGTTAGTVIISGLNINRRGTLLQLDANQPGVGPVSYTHLTLPTKLL